MNYSDDLDEDAMAFIAELEADAEAAGIDLDAFEAKMNANEELVSNAVFAEIADMANQLADIIKDTQGDWRNCQSHCWECSTLQGMQLYLEQAKANSLNAIGQMSMHHTLAECIAKLVNILSSTTMDETDELIVRATEMTAPGYQQKREREMAESLHAWEFCLENPNEVIMWPRPNES